MTGEEAMQQLQSQISGLTSTVNGIQQSLGTGGIVIRLENPDPNQNFWTSGNMISIIGFVITIITVLVSAWLNHKNNKRLNSYTLYNQKKYEVCPKIYQLIFKVQNAIEIIQSKLLVSINCESLSWKEVESYLHQLNIKDKLKDEIINLYHIGDFHGADQKIVSAKGISQYVNYNLSIHDLNKFFLENECYLEDELGDKIRKLTKDLFNLNANHQSQKIYSRPEMGSKYFDKIDLLSKEIDTSSDKIILKITEIKSEIKKQIKSS